MDRIKQPGSLRTIISATAVYALALLLIYISQNSFNDYILQIINNIFIFIILAVSYNLINGVTGQLSLEPNGFVAIGAYVTAIMLLDSDTKLDMYMLEDPSPLILAMHSEFIPALLLSGITAASVAFLLSFPVFRVRGDYLAIVTLGFGFIIRVLAVNNPHITNGSIGLNDIPEAADLYWSGTIAFLATLIILHLIYSKFGRAMKAVRDDEDAALAMGINTFWIKMTAFCTSAFLEGVGGGLLAATLTTISPDLFTFLLTFQLLIIIVLGGLGSTTGAIIGTILVIGGGEWLRFLDDEIVILGQSFGAHPGLRMVFFALILLLLMLFARRGLMGDREFWEKAFVKRSFGRSFGRWTKK